MSKAYRTIAEMQAQPGCPLVFTGEQQYFDACVLSARATGRSFDANPDFLSTASILDVLCEGILLTSMSQLAVSGYRVQVRPGYQRIALEAAARLLELDDALYDQLVTALDWRAAKYDPDFAVSKEDLVFVDDALRAFYSRVTGGKYEFGSLSLRHHFDIDPPELPRDDGWLAQLAAA